MNKLYTRKFLDNILDDKLLKIIDTDVSIECNSETYNRTWGFIRRQLSSMTQTCNTINSSAEKKIISKTGTYG